MFLGIEYSINQSTVSLQYPRMDKLNVFRIFTLVYRRRRKERVVTVSKYSYINKLLHLADLSMQ